jgi:hypothetical protein
MVNNCYFYRGIYTILCIVFISGLSYAQLDVSLSDQGTQVKDKSSGELLASGTITISIYDSLNGGNLIYTETFTNAIINGSWNVMLGENKNLPLEYGKVYYKDYVINGEDADFVNGAGSLVERQFFYSPLGNVAESDISKLNNLTFAFGQIIDNLINGWLRITGNLNVTGTVYADSFVGGGIGGGTSITYLNLTALSYNGEIINGTLRGYAAANNICNTEFIGTHFCTEFDVVSFIANSDFSSFTSSAWVIAGGPKYVPANVPVNDCNGWTHGIAGVFLGNYWKFNSEKGGNGAAINCGTSLPLACCK